MQEQADGAIPAISNYSRKSEDNFFICCTSASKQIYCRGLSFIRSCFHPVLWFRMVNHKGNYPQLHTAVGQDGG